MYNSLQQSKLSLNMSVHLRQPLSSLDILILCLSIGCFLFGILSNILLACWSKTLHSSSSILNFSLTASSVRLTGLKTSTIGTSVTVFDFPVKAPCSASCSCLVNLSCPNHDDLIEHLC